MPTDPCSEAKPKICKKFSKTIGNLFCPLAAPNDSWFAISTAFEEGGENPKKSWLVKTSETE